MLQLIRDYWHARTVCLAETIYFSLLGLLLATQLGWLVYLAVKELLLEG